MHQVHVGRISFTSPGTLGLSAGPDGKSLSINGRFGGKEHVLSHILYLRDELQSMAVMDDYVPFRYDGDATLNGYVKVRQASVNISKYLVGSVDYSIDMEYVGKEGDVQFESRLTGQLLENSFITSATTDQFHAAPGNSYAYFHNSQPGRNLRVARDITSSSATDTCNLYINQSSGLRNVNGTYNVDMIDYYKGACEIRMGHHLERVNNNDSDVITESVKCGKYAGDWTVGDTLIMDNGIIKLQLGTSTTTSGFNTYIWDVNQYATEKEWIFSEGTPASGQQHGDTFKGWHRVQILINRPEVISVRCTTYKDSDTRGKRLVVDFTLRRGSHFVGVMTNYYTAGTQINIALESAPNTVPNTTNLTDGYICDGSTSPEDGNFWIVGGVAEFDASTALTNNAVFRTDAAGAVFNFFIGYELVDPATSSALAHNEKDNVFKQYIDNINELQKLVKA